MQKILYVYAKFQSIIDKMNKLLYMFLPGIAAFMVVAQELERADEGFSPGMKAYRNVETGIQISPGSELSPKDSTSVKLTVFLEGPFDKGKMITELNKEGYAILLAEQNARKALQCSHRAYVFETGRVTLQGTAAEVAKDPGIHKAYLGLE